jgi:co-chaperonin GroES (HSP10)
VVVRRIESEERTAGGIIIPDTAKEKPQESEVIAIRSGARDEAGELVPLDLKAGDRIIFGKCMVRRRSQYRRRGSLNHEGVRRHGALLKASLSLPARPPERQRRNENQRMSKHGC